MTNSIQKLIETGVLSHVNEDGRPVMSRSAWEMMTIPTAHIHEPPRAHDYSKKEKDND